MKVQNLLFYYYIWDRNCISDMNYSSDCRLINYINLNINKTPTSTLNVVFFMEIQLQNCNMTHLEG